MRIGTDSTALLYQPMLRLPAVLNDCNPTQNLWNGGSHCVGAELLTATAKIRSLAEVPDAATFTDDI